MTNMNAQAVGPALFVSVVVGGLLNIGALYLGTKVAGIDTVTLRDLLFLTLALAGTALVRGLLAAVSGPGGKLLASLAGLGVNIWLIKEMLAVAWSGALIVWGTSVAAAIVTAVVCGAVLVSAREAEESVHDALLR